MGCGDCQYRQGNRALKRQKTTRSKLKFQRHSIRKFDLFLIVSGFSVELVSASVPFGAITAPCRRRQRHAEISRGVIASAANHR